MERRRIVLSDTCSLFDTKSVRLQYGADGTGPTWAGYDPADRVAEMRWDYWGANYGGGGGVERKFSYDDRGNRTFMAIVWDTYGMQYSYSNAVGGPRSRLQSAIATYGAAQYSGIGWNWTYDADGNVKTQRYPVDLSSADAGFTLQVGMQTGFESVVKTVNNQYGTYTYYYDLENRRVRKDNPYGNKDEFFWDLGHQLLEDTGNQYVISPAAPYPVDEYVWLGGRPVAMFRSSFTSGWARDNAATQCRRDGNDAKCGFYAIFSDYQGKPVVMTDKDNLISGVGEYEPFDMNKYMGWIDHHPSQTASGYQAVHTYDEQKHAGYLNLDYRVRLEQLDTEPACGGGNYDFYAFWNNATSSWASPVHVGMHQGGQWTTWVPANNSITLYYYGNGVQAKKPDCTNGAASYSGLGSSRFEFRRYQSGATPLFTNLRFPGQYYDAESELFENWNRYYDPSTGRYLSPEPMLRSPKYVRSMARGGTSVPTYAYALNNPIHYVDRNGAAAAAAAAPFLSPLLPAGTLAAVATAGGIGAMGLGGAGVVGFAGWASWSGVSNWADPPAGTPSIGPVLPPLLPHPASEPGVPSGAGPLVCMAAVTTAMSCTVVRVILGDGCIYDCDGYLRYLPGMVGGGGQFCPSDPQFGETLPVPYNIP